MTASMNMWVRGGFCLAIVTVLCQARPPRQESAHPKEPETADKDVDKLGLEYNRYLQEVVQALESDPEFRKKLEEADVDKIRDGSIADELDFVHHGLRSQLDDIKRREIERLRHLAKQQFEQREGIDRRHAKIPDHLELNSLKFEKNDLKKLIQKTTKDLEEADVKRRTEFKQYEMKKKYDREERLRNIHDEAKRREEENKIKEMEEKHKKHEKVHHPLTKDQLEEVWDKEDHMDVEDFDPKLFFAMHDLNGDDYLDEEEVKMLFLKDLEKVYDPNASEDDMVERQEEMERMREHVFREADKDGDMLISRDEFLEETNRKEFDEDPGWTTYDEEENDAFTDEEFRAYEMMRKREMQDHVNRGVQAPGGHMPEANMPYQHPNAQPQPQAGIPGQPAYKPQGSAHGEPAFRAGGGSIPGQPAYIPPVPEQPAGQAHGEPVYGQPVHHEGQQAQDAPHQDGHPDLPPAQ